MAVMISVVNTKIEISMTTLKKLYDFQNMSYTPCGRFDKIPGHSYLVHVVGTTKFEFLCEYNHNSMIPAQLTPLMMIDVA
jgi:hypothetical protein